MKTFKVYLKTHLMATSELIEEPEGLSDYRNKLIRHKEYGTVFMDITFDIQFVKDGMEYLKAAFADDSHKAAAAIEIEEYNSDTNEYVNIYEGIADFAEYQQTEITASVSWESSSKIQMLRSRDDNKYQLTSTKSTDGITVPSISTLSDYVLLPPFDFQAFMEANEVWNDSIDWTFLPWPGSDPSLWPQYETHEMSSEITVTANEIGQAANISNGFLDVPSDGTITEEGTLIIKFDLNLDLDNGTKGHSDYISATVKVRNQQDGSVLWTSSVMRVDAILGSAYPLQDNWYVQHTIDLAGSTVVVTGDIISYDIELWIEWSNPTSIMQAQYNYDSTNSEIENYRIDYNQGRVENMFTKIFYPYEAMCRQIQLITSELDKTHLLDSSIIGKMFSDVMTYPSIGAWAGLMVTSGRGIYNHEKTNVSFRDLFNAINAIEPVGLWYDKANDIFKLEKLEEFYLYTNIATLADVSDLKISTSKDHLYSNIKGGYEFSQGNEYVNGDEEYNTDYEMATTLKNINNTKDVVSPIRADTIGINNSRLKYERNELSQDSTTNEKVFFIHTDITVLEPYNGTDMTSVTGLRRSEQWMNLFITPKRNMWRQLKRLNTIYPKLYENAYLRYVYSKATNNITTTYVPDYMGAQTEQSDINIGSIYITQIGAMPEIYEFEAHVSQSERIAIKANPHGYITFTSNGSTYRGFILDVDLNNAKNNGTFKLLKKAP